MFKFKELSILFICLILISTLTSCTNSNPNAKVVGEYDTSKLGANFGDSEAYEIGANAKGMPIFKNSNKAFQQVQKDYKEGFSAIAEEFNLKPVNKSNWRAYGTYGAQLTTGSDEARKQGFRISQFFDIYENGFQ